MQLKALAIAVLLIFLFGDTERAFAWGPVTHIGLADSILAQLGYLPAAVAAILARHPLAYRYGNIAADVVFGKRLSRVKQSCHHWSTAFALLDSSSDDKAKAFAYGYLSHLAADTVAHGKYVPRQIALSECTVNFGHLYWELRASETESKSSWSALQRLLHHDHAHHHQALARHITDTFLTYRLNRLLFDGMTTLAIHRSFRRTVGVWTRCSRWYLPPHLISSYRAECLDRIHSALGEGARSPLVREDPNGTSAFMNLHVRRREMRKLRRRGLPVQNRILEASVGLAPLTSTVGHARPTTAFTMSSSAETSNQVATVLR